MLNNNIPISRIIGIGVLGLTVMGLSLFFEEFSRNFARERINGEEILILGIMFIPFIAGLGLIFKQNWARILTIIIMVIIIIGWIFGALVNLRAINIDAIPILGATVFLVTFALSVSLLLFNEKVITEFGDQPINDLEDTIDGQFFEK